MNNGTDDGQLSANRPETGRPSPFRAVALGHSHLIALLDGLSAPDEQEVAFIQVYLEQFQPAFVVQDGQFVLGDTLLARLDEAIGTPPADALVVSPIGGEHYIWAVQGQSRPFDVVLPFAPDLPRVPDAELVPFALLWRFFQDTVAPYMRAMGRLADRYPVPVFQVLPPPPVTRDERVAASSAPPFDTLIAAHGPPARWIRMKLWLLWRALAQEVARETGVILLDPPPAALDGDGFLTEPFCYTDAVHANGAYGALVWNQVRDRVGAR